MFGRATYFIRALALAITFVGAAAMAQTITERTVTGFDVVKALESGEFTALYEGNAGNQRNAQAFVLDRNDSLPLVGSTYVFTEETDLERIAPELNSYVSLGGISEIRMDGKVIAYVTPGDSTYNIYLVDGGYVVTITDVGTGSGDADLYGPGGEVSG